MSRRTAAKIATYQPSTPCKRWPQAGAELAARLSGVCWDIVDWVLTIPAGTVDADTSELTGLSVSRIRHARYMARRFPMDRRREKLSYSLHYTVAPLPEDVGDELLDRAVAEDWKVRRMKKEAASAAFDAQVQQRAAAREQDDPISIDFNTEASRTERTLHKLAVEVAAALRTADAVLGGLAAHPGRKSTHGNRLNGVVERFDAIFSALDNAVGTFTARADKRFAPLLAKST